MGKKIMALKPISYYGQFTPTGVDQSGARRMQALAGLGETVAGLGTKFSIDKAEREAPALAEQAVEEARTVDEEGKVSYGEVSTKNGYGSDLFNRTVINAQLSQRNTDSKVRLIELATEFADDPAGYENASKAYFDATINSAPIELRQDLIAAIAPRIATATANISKAFEVSTQNQSIDTLSNGVDVGVIDIEKLARNGDAELVSKEKEILFAEMDALAEVSPKYASDLEAEKRKVERSIILQTEIGNVDRAIFNENLSNEEKLISGAKFLEDFRTSEIEGVSPTEKDQMLGLISQRLNGVRQAYKAELAEVKKDQGMIRVGNVIDSVTPIGDQIPITQKDANDYYAEVTFQKLPSDNPDARGAKQTDFVAKTGLVPAMLKQELTNDLMSGDVNRIQAASETIGRLTEIPGIGQTVLTDYQRALATEVNSLSQFMGADLATQQAIKNTDPTNKARIEARTAEIKSTEGKKTFSGSYRNEMLEEYGSGYFEKFNVNDIAQYDLIKDYGTLVESYYISGMSVDNAKEQAMKSIQTNYKEGEFGFMKFRPEDYYGLGVTDSVNYIREDIYNELTGPSGIFGLELDKKDIVLVSDSITARQASTGNPSYTVMYRDSNGTLNTAVFAGQDQNGNEVMLNRYTPDILTAEEEEMAIIKDTAEQEMRAAQSGQIYASTPDLRAMSK
tara:strand:+ start:453 stop:2489 length:2037 start_codon:yes stop_codon:yes gene_type:complete